MILFHPNQISSSGGLTIISGCSAELAQSSISFNEAGKDGGGITVGYIVGYFGNVDGSSSIRLISCMIEGNSASDGGGINAYSDVTIELSSSVIRTNQGVKYGGGLKLSNDVTLNMEQSTIYNNTAETGGGLYTTTRCAAEFKRSNVELNSAENLGGGIYMTDDASLVTDSSVIVGNAANNGGGGVYANRCSLALNNGTQVRDNLARRGGGIKMQYSDLIVRQSLFQGNVATETGELPA